MWINPRATIQQIVDTSPEHLVLFLAAVVGFSNGLDQASARCVGDTLPLPMIFLIALIAGPVGGVIGLYISGALIYWTGTWIGGNASSQNIRAAIAWSQIPMIWGLLLWIPALALFGEELFTTEMPTVTASPSMAFSLLIYTVVELAVGLWTLVVFIQCLAQVQGFSVWKVVGNLLLSVLVILPPFLIIFLATA